MNTQPTSVPAAINATKKRKSQPSKSTAKYNISATVGINATNGKILETVAADTEQGFGSFAFSTSFSAPS